MAVQRMTLSLQIQNKLQSRLLNGTYKVGEYLPGEMALSEEFNVSRTTMRDAIGALVEKGFLERQHGKGVLVIDKSNNVAVDSIRNMILRGNYTVAEFMETREMIDRQVATFAAMRAPKEDIEEMRKCIQMMEDSSAQLDKYVEYDLQFHRDLAAASKNHLLIALASAIEPMLRQIVTKVVAATGAVEKNCKYHTQILNSIEKGGVEETIKCMAKHNRASEQMLKESIENNDNLESIIIG